MKSFNEIYDKIQETYKVPLEEKRKTIRNRILIASIITILIAIYLNIIFLILIFIIIIMIFFKSSKNQKQYIKFFKENVVGMFIKEYCNTLEYKPTEGMPKQIYREGEFERYDIYSTEDLITGTLNEKYKIMMAEVHTEDKSTDSKGNTTYTTIFHGLFAKIQFDKTVDANIKLRRNTMSLFRKDGKLEMDSSEFEKIFDVYADNKIITMQLLTSDTMQMLLDFKEKNKLTPEITLKDNTLYIRFATGNMFEPNIFKNSLDYDTLKKYYDTINFTLDISEKFLKNIEETEI